MMFYVGIDPGVSGGIAVLSESGAVVSAVSMPKTPRDILDALIFTVDPAHHGVRAVIERVSASPQMGVVSAFTFGRGLGGLHMALTAAGITFDEVTPGVWQGAMGVRQTTGKTSLGTSAAKKDKNITKRRAQALFPGVVVTHATADALLLAEFWRRRWGHAAE